MVKTFSKSGSALLTVLLVLTALAGVILYATKASLDATRALSKRDNSGLAEQMSQSGIEEGLLRLKKSDDATLGLVGGIYGSATPGKSVAAPQTMRRGYRTGTSCAIFLPAQIATASPVYDRECPYYDVTVRNFVKITSANLNRFSISDSDLVKDVALKLKVPVVNGSMVLQGTGIATSELRVKLDGVDKDWSASGQISVINVQTIEFIKKVPSLGSKKVTINSVVGEFITESPQVAIEATGFAGGVQRSQLLTIPRYTIDKAKRTVVDFGGSFDENGFLK